MAQSVERTLGKGEVPSSILGISTIKEETRRKTGFFCKFSVRCGLLDVFIRFITDRFVYIDVRQLIISWSKKAQPPCPFYQQEESIKP